MGMTDYESEIYSTLLDRGVCAAKQISEFSGVPVTRVYETLKEMEGRGLVGIMETRPKKYRIMTLSGLENLVEEKGEKMKQKIDKAEKAYKKIKDKAPNPDKKVEEEEERSFWLLRGRHIGSSSENDITSSATENELLQFSGDLSWVPEQIDLFKKFSERGVDIKLLYHEDRAAEDKVEMLKNVGVKMKGWEKGFVRGKIMDDNKALLVYKVPRKGVDENAHTGEPGTKELFLYDRIITDNPKFVKMMRRYFFFFWNQNK